MNFSLDFTKIMNDIALLTEAAVKFFETHKTLLASLTVTFVLMFVVSKALDILHKKVKDKLEKHIENTPLLKLLPISIKILKFVVMFILLASFLQTNGYSVTSLIAGFGIAGMAVGFAAQESIANIFGFLEVVSDKVYNIGDYIQFNGMEGTVQEINFRSTKISTMDNYIVNIPNSIMANTAVLNMTPIPCRRIDMFIGIEYSTPNEKIDRAVEILKQVCIDHPQVENNIIAFVSSLDASQITLRLYVNVTTPIWSEFVEIKSQVIKEIVKRYRAEGIAFAFPSQSLYVQNVDTPVVQ